LDPLASSRLEHTSNAVDTGWAVTQSRKITILQRGLIIFILFDDPKLENGNV
jgi:hypothetical protein